MTNSELNRDFMENKETLIDYRLTQLENNFKTMQDDLAVIRQIVTRMDAKFGGSEPLQCSAHSVRMDALEKRTGTTEERLEQIIDVDLASIKKFQWKFVGGLSVAVLL